jgi:HTH-type transcriptional regulator, sugar sensing transcriptional regulator
MDNLNTELLEEIGLTKSEIAVYLALLEIGSSSTGKIVEKSKVASSKIYEILDKLIHKGLVSYVIKANIKHFEASSPKRLIDYMKEKKDDLEKKEKELENIIPQLELKRSLSKNENETHVFKGIKGAKTAFDDILQVCKKNDEIQILGFSDVSIEFQNFLINFHNKRSKQGIKLKTIFGKGIKNLINEFKKIPLTEVKVSLSDEQRSVAFILYKDKVLFSIPSENLWIQIKSKKLNDSFKNYFNDEWNKETNVVKGLDAIENIFNDMLNYKQCDFIGARGYLMDKRPKFTKEWAKKAEKLNFKLRNIVDKDVKNHIITKLSFAETKYTLEKEFVDLSVFWIYGDKVIITNWTGEEPIAIIIENKKVYEMYKKQFELLWKR